MSNKFERNDCNGFEKGKKSKLISKLSKKLPIIQWLPQYNRMTATSDVIAGVTLGLTLVPQSLAYASLAGLQMHYGLYSAFIGTILYVFVGTIKEVSIGPTSLMALLVHSICKDLPIEHVVLLTFLSGCVVMLMGLLHLGFLVDLISAPVTSGFTSATSIIIVASQLKGILGLKFQAESVLDNALLIYQHIAQVKLADIVLGVCCCTVLLLLRQIKELPARNAGMKKALWFISIGRNALVVLVSSLIAVNWNSGHPPFALSGKVVPGLPPFSLPPFSVTRPDNSTASFLEMCSDLGSGILVTPIVMVLANIAIAKSFSSGARVDATQEMLSLGLCNMMGSLFHAMPTTGAFTRSAVSSSSGVKTPMAGLYSGIMTLMALKFLTEYFYFIPKATLSSVLICAVVFMIDYKTPLLLWKRNKGEWCMLMLTLALGLVRSVEMALFVGILANISILVYSWARPDIAVSRLKASTGGEYVKVLPGVGLFYLNIDYFVTQLQSAASEQGEGVLPIVIDCSRLQTIDYSACQGLEQVNGKFKKTTQKLIFFNASTDVIAKLQHAKSIESRHLHLHSETELLEALFNTKDDFSRMEASPLLAEAFRKKDSICEYTVKYEMNDMSDGKLVVTPECCDKENKNSDV